MTARDGPRRPALDRFGARVARLLAGEGTETAGPVHYSESNPDGDSEDIDPATIDDELRTWRAECTRADPFVADLDLDATRAHRHLDELSLRWVLTHTVEECAGDGGHADLLRELIDGTTGDWRGPGRDAGINPLPTLRTGRALASWEAARGGSLRAFPKRMCT